MENTLQKNNINLEYSISIKNVPYFWQPKQFWQVEFQQNTHLHDLLLKIWIIHFFKLCQKSQPEIDQHDEER